MGYGYVLLFFSFYNEYIMFVIRIKVSAILKNRYVTSRKMLHLSFLRIP